MSALHEYVVCSKMLCDALQQTHDQPPGSGSHCGMNSLISRKGHYLPACICMRMCGQAQQTQVGGGINVHDVRNTFPITCARRTQPTSLHHFDTPPLQHNKHSLPVSQQVFILEQCGGYKQDDVRASPNMLSLKANYPSSCR